MMITKNKEQNKGMCQEENGKYGKKISEEIEHNSLQKEMWCMIREEWKETKELKKVKEGYNKLEQNSH